VNDTSSTAAASWPPERANTDRKCSTVRSGPSVVFTVLPKDLAQRVRHLAQRRARLDSRDNRRHEVRAVSRSPLDGTEGVAAGPFVTRRSQLRYRKCLTALDFRVEPKDLDRPRPIRFVPVDPTIT
jgi:hypothetical protein